MLLRYWSGVPVKALSTSRQLPGGSAASQLPPSAIYQDLAASDNCAGAGRGDAIECRLK